MRTRQRASTKRRVGRIVAAVVGAALMVGGGVVVAGVVFAPQAVEKTYGDVKTAVVSSIEGVREEVLGDLPTVRLGVSGHIAELDRCDGTFTHMASYEHADVPPIWAAHNMCAGDVLLAWEVGQRVMVEGDDQVYAVVDIRETPKTWATIDDLIGLRGSFVLQSCFYGEDRMKFVGLAPIETAAAAPGAAHGSG